MRFPAIDSLYLTPAMRFSKALISWSILSLGAMLMGAMLPACSPDPGGENLPFLRSPISFHADTTASNHPFCDQDQPFADKAECLKAKKYHLTWIRPEDTAHFRGYRIYLDTLDPRASGKRWNDVKKAPEFASIIVQSRAAVDSLVFVFGSNGFKQDTLRSGMQKIFVLDSNLREDEATGNLDFALVPVYDGGVAPGGPLFTYFRTRDRESPEGFHPSFVPRDTQVEIAWERPTDRITFFDPSQDTGLIKGYEIEVVLRGNPTPDYRRAFRPKLLSYRVGSQDMTAKIVDSVGIDTLRTTYFFKMPDSNRAAKRTLTNQEDSLYLVIGNVRPLDTISFRLYAIDSSGNHNRQKMEDVQLITTDITQPSKPVIVVDKANLGRNGFTVKWGAARDSVGERGSFAPGPSANFNIQSYRLTRLLVRDSAAKTTEMDRLDSIILIDTSTNGKQDTFEVEMRFLPPGTRFHLRLTAFDNSGFASITDTLTLRTDSVRFAGADSALECPAGFIPVPRGAFKLGDDACATCDDERPSGKTVMAPYCIEPYEHRDSTGKRFVSNVTYAQAAEICAGVDSGFSTQLCSEAEWERACEGSDSIGLLHGIQSEGNNPTVLQASCNQGTNDSAMAMSFELRNSICLTTEGIYDMAGNLSEWVRDPYVSKAYLQRKDTLDHFFTFRDTGGEAVSRPGIRGGNYLKTGFPQLSLTQNLARCSNRDYAAQVRPRFREECKDESKRKIAVIYGAGLPGHRCIDIDTIKGLNADAVTEIIPDQADTLGTTLLAFLAGKKDPLRIKLSPDSALKNIKPIRAALTTRSLAAVTFVSSKGEQPQPDTLDATEMKDTSQAALERIFKREAPSPDWSVRKVDGKFEIKFLYAYTIQGTLPAKPFYSNRVIGFRCCSVAKAKPAPVDTTIVAKE
jgi:hypothetical protein